jgi:HEAT repeat protein
MTSRSRWPVWALCAVALAGCLAVVLLSKPRGPVSERAPGLATPGSDLAQGEPERAPLVSNRPSNDPGAQASEVGSRRPSGEAKSVYQPAASASSASREAAELVAGMTREQLLEAVTSTNQILQTAAAFAIARQPTPGLLAGLLAAASASSDGKTRSALLSAIASVRSEECLGELVQRLGTKQDGDLQEAARTSLLRSSSPAVVDALIARAEGSSSDEYLCREIARTLASVRGSAALTNLLAGMASPIPAVAAGCAFALGAIGDPSTVEALFARLGTAQGTQEAILAGAIARVWSPAALPVLSAHLRLPAGALTDTARRAALTALGNYSAEQRPPILNEYLAAETDPRWQAEARRLLNN